MAGYINPDGQARLVTKVFGNTNGKTVRAKSLWTNKDGVATCIYREGERDLYIVGLDAGVGNNVFPMVYSYDFETFRACSITMPSTHSSYKPSSIKQVIYSEELGLFVALGYYLQRNYTSSSPLYWYLMYSEDGRNWEVALASSYTYYSTNIFMEYEPNNHLFLVANRGPNPSRGGFYFYSSTDGKNWTQSNTIKPTNAANTKTYTAYNIDSLLVPGDGYIYLSGVEDSTFYDGSKYYPFIRTKNGTDFELYGKGVSYNDASIMYGCRSLLYRNGVYYSLDEGMYVYNSEMTSQSKDYYTVGIHKSSDSMQSWEYIPLGFSSIDEDWSGSDLDGFFTIGNELFCSIAKESYESYLYSSVNGSSWSEEAVEDNILGSVYEYLYIPASKENLIQIENKLYRTRDFRLSSTQTGTEYTEETALAENMRYPFSLSSSGNYAIAAKIAD